MDSSRQKPTHTPGRDELLHAGFLMTGFPHVKVVMSLDSSRAL
jgi:hypothetical protein